MNARRPLPPLRHPFGIRPPSPEQLRRERFVETAWLFVVLGAALAMVLFRFPLLHH